MLDVLELHVSTSTYAAFKKRFRIFHQSAVMLSGEVFRTAKFRISLNMLSWEKIIVYPNFYRMTFSKINSV